MRIVKVTYTAKAEFVEQNQANIRKVMADLQEINSPGLLYHCCLGQDGQSFIHTAFFDSDEAHAVLNQLPAFKRFQEELKAKGLETPPKQELLTFVGSSKSLFKS